MASVSSNVLTKTIAVKPAYTIWRSTTPPRPMNACSSTLIARGSLITQYKLRQSQSAARIMSCRPVDRYQSGCQACAVTKHIIGWQLLLKQYFNKIKEVYSDPIADSVHGLLRFVLHIDVASDSVARISTEEGMTETTDQIEKDKYFARFKYEGDWTYYQTIWTWNLLQTLQINAVTMSFFIRDPLLQLTQHIGLGVRPIATVRLYLAEKPTCA